MRDRSVRAGDAQHVIQVPEGVRVRHARLAPEHSEGFAGNGNERPLATVGGGEAEDTPLHGRVRDVVVVTTYKKVDLDNGVDASRLHE